MRLGKGGEVTDRAHRNDLCSQFGMAATAHLTVFGLGLVSAGLGGRVEYGWQEI